MAQVSEIDELALVVRLSWALSAFLVTVVFGLIDFLMVLYIVVLMVALTVLS